MKISIITCHKVYNYGANLQVYALQTFLESKGHKVNIIDYVPEATNSQFDFWYVSPNSRFHNLCKRFRFVNWLYAVLNSFRVNNSKRRNASFELFQSSHYNLTRRYTNVEELRNDPPEADIYIAGSDQIWNPLSKNGKDLAFYLDFGPASVKRLSYAASFSVSSSSVTDDHALFIREYLIKFDRISVRETTGLDILKRVSVAGVHVLDPVFLLSKEDWLKIVPNKRLVMEKYILVYHLFAESEGLVDFVKKKAYEKSLKIVAINDRNYRNYADIQINNAGPAEFISLISNAEMVVADSFHATAFSIIFNKDFYIFYMLPNMARMVDLLNAIGLGKRFNAKDDEEIKWGEINMKVEQLKHVSFTFLSNL